MRVLFVDDLDEIRQLYITVLDDIFDDLDVVEANSGNSAVEILEKDNNFDLIICDYMMDNGNGATVYSKVKEFDKKINYILFSTKELETLCEFNNFPEREGVDSYINKLSGLKSFKEHILKVVLRSEMSKRDRDYQKIRIYNFWKYNRALCDIYLKLSDIKFIKIIHGDDYYSKSDIDRYVRKNQKFLYIKRNDFEMFQASMTRFPFLVFEGERQKENALIATHAMIHELVSSVGIGKLAIKLASKSVTEVEKVVKNENELFRAFIKFRDRRDYLYDHSYILSCICCSVCKRMNWTTSDIIKKLVYASLFHDLLLDDSELAFVDKLDSEQLMNYDYEEIDKVKTHPLKMAEIVSKVMGIPLDVETIIAQHHENVHGTGFPYGLKPTQIMPIVCVFIISHDFVNELYKNNFDPVAIPEVCERFKKKYAVGNFEKIIEAFISGFKAFEI